MRIFPRPYRRVVPLPRSVATVIERCMGGCALVLLLGCRSGDLKSELDSVRSWTATTQLAAERRMAGATNRAVSLQLTERAARAKELARQQLAQLARTDSDRAIARATLDSLQQGIELLRRVAR